MREQPQGNYEATTEGQRAGRLMLPASLNPYAPGTEDHAEWERVRFQTQARHFARRAA